MAISVAVPVGAVAIVGGIIGAVWYKKTHPKYRKAKKIVTPGVEMRDVEKGTTGHTPVVSHGNSAAALVKPALSKPAQASSSESESTSESESDSTSESTASSDVTSDSESSSD